MSNGKGSRDRTKNFKKFRYNFDSIFELTKKMNNRKKQKIEYDTKQDYALCQ